jgi:hypothetical protein
MAHQRRLLRLRDEPALQPQPRRRRRGRRRSRLLPSHFTAIFTIENGYYVTIPYHKKQP